MKSKRKLNQDEINYLKGKIEHNIFLIKNEEEQLKLGYRNQQDYQKVVTVCQKEIDMWENEIKNGVDKDFNIYY